MRPRLKLGESVTGDTNSPADAALACAATFALDNTLAIPADAKISENTPLAESKTQAVTVAMTMGHEPGAALASGILREPIVSTHFAHAYPSESDALKELGRGGIGRVVLAFDRTIGREVAMKELLPELLADDVVNGSLETTSHTQRFLREARITGQLEHPNIVPVYELGRQQSGCLYYTMRVVRGRTLASAVKHCSKLQERLALVNHFAGLCQAIAYAHSRGVVHRDIKPENVMIGEFGETFVLDWGLANVVDNTPHSLRAAASLSLPPRSQRREPMLFPGTADAFHTQMGSIVGTPHYMSPEQLLHRSDGCSPTSDVWSLGVVLYTILTGSLPYDASNLGELILKLQKGVMPAIDQVEPGAPRDLAAIAGRALTTDPARRYRDARAMAQDVAAYQAGDKVAVYEYSSFELLRRFARRHRSSLAVAAVSGLSLLLLGISAYRRVTSARDQAIAAERRAVSGEQQAKLNLGDVLVERARAEVAQGNPSSATLLAVGALELLERPDARGMLIALSNTDGVEAVALPYPQEPCRAVEYNPQLLQFACVDSERLSIFSLDTARTEGIGLSSPFRNVYAAGKAGWIALDSRAALTLIGPKHATTAMGSLQAAPSIVAIDRLGSTLAVVDKENRLLVYSTSESRPLAILKPSHAITALAFHPTERLIALGGYRGELSVWQWRDAQHSVLLGKSHSTVRVLTFNNKGSVLATGGSDGSVQLWDIQQHQPLQLPMRDNNGVMSLSFAPNDRQLAVAMRSGVLEVLDAISMDSTVRLTTGYATLNVEFTTNDELIGLADETRPVRFRIHTAFPKQRFISRGNVLSLTWAPNHRDLLVGGLRENGLCRLDVSNGTCGDRLPLRTNIVRRVIHSAARHQLVVAGTGGKVEIWDATNNLPLGFVDVPIPEVRDLAFLPEQHRVAVVGNAPQLAILDIDTMGNAVVSQLPGPAQSLAMLTSQSQLAIGLRNGSILFKSLEQGRSDTQLPLASGWPIGMAHWDARNWLVIAEDNGTVSVFDSKTKTRLGTATTNMGRLTAFALDAVNGLIAVGGESRDVMVLNADPTPRVMARLQDHRGTVRALLFDPPNWRLYSAGDDGIVRLWQLDALRTAPETLRVAAERKYGMRVEAGRIIRTTEK